MSELQRILVIGVGSIGERHTRCFQQTGRADVGICEINDELRATIAERYGIARAFASLDEIPLAEFDAAVICTPAQLHIPLAMKLVEAGLHLLIEKPLSTSLKGVVELQKLATVKSRQIGIAYVYRSHPVLGAMREAIQSGRFGTPLNFIATGGQHFPFYRPAYRETYYTRHETGGGAIQDAITHVMNAMEWLVGPITRLVADAEHLALPGVEVEDTVHLITRHNAVMGSFSLNQHQAPNESSITIVCSEGTVRIEMHRCRWMSCTEPGTDWNVELEMTLERDDLFIRQAGLFLDVLENNAAPTCSLEEATQTLKVNLAALRSVRENKWIAIKDV